MKEIIFIIFMFTICFFCIGANTFYHNIISKSPVLIGDKGISSTIDDSAYLEIYGNAKGFLLPRLTTTQRDGISSTATGLQIYNITTSQPQFYNGSSWKDFGFTNPMTTNGDIIYQAAGAATRLGVGLASQVLTVDPATLLPSWKAATGGSGSISWTQISDYSLVGNVGDTSQTMAGHILLPASFSSTSRIVALYNLSDNSDASGNSNTLNDADAYNAGEGIFNIATTSFLGSSSTHLEASSVTGGGLLTGDIDISMGCWAKMPVSSYIMSFGSNSALQKMKLYLDSSGYITFDTAGTTYVHSSDGALNAVWHHFALVYDASASEMYAYLDGRLVRRVTGVNDLAVQANPSIWINSNTDDGTETAGYEDECFVYSDFMDQKAISKIVASRYTITGQFSSNDFNVTMFKKENNDSFFIKQENWCEVARDSDYLYRCGFQNNITQYDSLRIIGL